jgi:predicted phosphodiesterase
MKILIISDLHIDPRDNFGTFRWSEMDLIMQIETLRDLYNIDRIIFNGDVYELFKYRYEDIVKANPLLVRYFRDNDFIFIKGNHDMMSPSGLDHFQIINSSGQVIHIEHGHSADWLNGSRIGRTIGKLGLLLLKKMSHSKFMMDKYFKIVAWEDQINHIPKNYNTLKYLTYALKLLQKYDVVILGHTHKLETHHTYYINRKKRYLNCGACSMGRFQGIIMDTETLKYELIKETSESLKNTLRTAMAI